MFQVVMHERKNFRQQEKIQELNKRKKDFTTGKGLDP